MDLSGLQRLDYRLFVTYDLSNNSEQAGAVRKDQYRQSWLARSFPWACWRKSGLEVWRATSHSWFPTQDENPVWGTKGCGGNRVRLLQTLRRQLRKLSSFQKDIRALHYALNSHLGFCLRDALLVER